MSKWKIPHLPTLGLVMLAVFGVEAAKAQETPAATRMQTEQPAEVQTQQPAATPVQQTQDAGQVQAPPTDGDAILPGDDVDASSANPALPHDLSPTGMFLAADIVVKSVMTALALASVLTWAILLVKVFEIGAAKRSAKRAVRVFSEAVLLRDVKHGSVGRSGPSALMIAAATDELAKSEAVLDTVSSQGVKERVASQLTRIEAKAGKSIAAGTGVLATIGSISPFVGLFGTVWGIMNSFIGISQAQTTNLAIVAPGIAEALLATAIGLVAAIPAVVIYNYFARSISGYRVIIADASAAVERLVSRDLDFRQLNRIAPRKDAHAHSDAGIARIR